MNHIEKQRIRETGSLDAVSFFHLLVEEGCRLSLISSGQLETLQYQLVELLAGQFNRWTGGFSSSVPVETGRQIQQSVFYTVGCYLKSLADAERALEVLKSVPLKDLFSRGKKLVDEKLAGAARLLGSIQKNRLSTDVLAYNDTLDAGLPMFFSSYDTDYGAHETPASVDYPLGNDKMNLTGIEYLSKYLRKLQLENEFCAHFPPEEIQCLLRGYDRQYKELLFNIYELVLTNAVGCLLIDRTESEKSGKNTGSRIGLRMSDYGRQYLQRELGPLPPEQIDRLVDEAVSRICKALSISNMELSYYITTSAVSLKSRLRNALETDGLRHLFPSPEEESEPSIRFEDRAKLDNGSFRRLADEIRVCSLISDKILLLRKEPLSLEDLIDLLEGDCFFGDEFWDVFASLEDIQLALLTKNMPLDPADSSFLAEESDREWLNCLNSFLSQLDPGRSSAILALAERLEIIPETGQ